MFKSNSECFFILKLLTNISQGLQHDEFELFVKDNEWPGVSTLRKLNRGASITIYHTISGTLISLQSWIIAALAILQALSVSWVLRFSESSSEDFVFRLLSLIFFGDLS